ncbi:TPR-like protein [Dioscorea alata]|uniref:TPR-like protein n=1 Tax=Dioscorea alata TaxID=55571 RepID=A0ACB7TRS2_DIOAL|nr:TPR-like protein [Dioscorea alata]
MITHHEDYASSLLICARRRLFLLGRSLHRRVLSIPIPLPLILSNHLINFYSKCGRPDLARKVFDVMPHRNLVSWTALLTGYAHRGLHDSCFRLFSTMLADYLPNEFGFSAVLGSCAAARCTTHGRQVHALALKTSLHASVFVSNALITMYSSCCSVDEEDDAWVVFRTMPFRDVITWNAMITGFLSGGHPQRSLKLFAEMRQCGVAFDKATMVCVISSCCGLQHCRELHGLVTKSGFESEVEVGTALLKAYAGFGGDGDDCLKIFEGIQEHDIVSWTGIIASCAEQEPEKAILLFCHLQQQDLKPDRYTFSIVIRASAGFATERHCLALYSLIVRYGFGDDLVLCNALIHAYAHCGSIQLAERVFEQMTTHDQVSWNSMIMAYAAHGCGREALSAFACMDVPPDSATFVGVLTACSHGGLVNDGRDLFKAMLEVYGIAPQLDHFACMVDILGRAGKLLEAEDLINQMPMKPDSVIWSSLLGACRKHGEAKIAEKAARMLMELDPQNSVGYVMMSNIYSARGSFSNAASFRKGMKVYGVKKDPGLSWIEIGNHIHEFSAGGLHHPQREEIYEELKKLVIKVKEVGYVADIRLVFHEIEEEYKEERLLLHSEKLALVFGLMNSSSTLADLRIMKNIRICEDCHNFIKLTSKCTDREIVVRDVSRFHHFKDGHCSCGNYW